jgi:hypothetical protein
MYAPRKRNEMERNHLGKGWDIIVLLLKDAGNLVSNFAPFSLNGIHFHAPLPGKPTFMTYVGADVRS